MLAILETIIRCLIICLFIPFYWIKYIFASVSAKPKDLCGKIVVVSGAGNGLGRELCKQLAQLGCIVLGVDVKPEDLEETLQIVRKQEGSKQCAYGYVCDIADESAVEKLRDDIIGKFKKMTQAFLKHMKERREGHIIYTNSIMAVVASKESTIYSTTKSALTGFTVGLKDELYANPEYKNIFISVAHPYFIKTNNFIKDNISLSSPPMEVEDAASSLIDGTRRNYFEFLIPGGELGLRILRLIRCIPWEVYVLLKDSAVRNVIYDDDLENVWQRYMTRTSQKLIFNRKNNLNHESSKN